MDRKRSVRAVLDTNVLLSLQRIPLLLLARRNMYQLVWSEYIEAEMQRVMLRMGWQPTGARVLLRSIDRVAERVDYLQVTGGNYDEWLTDIDDHPIMATAIVGGVDYLVSDNTKDFPPKKRFAGITVITSDAFLRLFDS